MKIEEKESFAVGGQALIEGVMMRGRDFVAAAVRVPDGEISVKEEPFRSILVRLRMSRVPLLRGAVGLVEAMIIGMRMLSYSAEAAMPEEEKPKNSSELREKISMGLTIAFAFVAGLGLFFYLPLILTDLVPHTEGKLGFNLVDGIFRLAIFLLYIWLISLWSEMRRVFEYHGAEHKTINSFEAGDEMTPQGVMARSRFHPRCGTSFLLLVMVISILVFMLLDRPETIGDRLLRIAFVPVIGGVSYEFIRLSGKPRWRRLFGPLVQPGLWLQRLTTREPDEAQCEVAIAALSACLDPETRKARIPQAEPLSAEEQA